MYVPGARTMWPTPVLASALVRLVLVLTWVCGDGDGGGGEGDGGGGDGDGGGGDGGGSRAEQVETVPKTPVRVVEEQTVAPDLTATLDPSGAVFP